MLPVHGTHPLATHHEGAWVTDYDAIEAALALMSDDDPHHPLTVLGTWEMMLREDYGHPSHERITIASAAGYLDRMLHRFANDPEQDWALFAREIHECRAHLEAVLHDQRTPDLGAPCPECETPAKRLRKEWGHWCYDDDCERIHDATGELDRWVCPVDPDHWWSDGDYRKRVADVYLDNAETLTLPDLAARTDIPARTLRHWVQHERLKSCGTRHSDGKKLYAVQSALNLRMSDTVAAEGAP